MTIKTIITYPDDTTSGLEVSGPAFNNMQDALNFIRQISRDNIYIGKPIKSVKIDLEN